MKNPTEAQLNDPKWWDENAPEKATHYDTACKCFFCEGGWWPDGEWKPYSSGTVIEGVIATRKCIERPTKPAAPEWDGEGLPPVGATEKDCELVGIHHGPKRFEVIAHRNHAAIVFVPSSEDEGDAFPALACHFRPLRTAEQRQREKVIIKASQSIQSFDGISMRQSTSEELAVHLYDAGMLRKGDE